MYEPLPGGTEVKVNRYFALAQAMRYGIARTKPCRNHYVRYPKAKIAHTCALGAALVQGRYDQTFHPELVLRARFPVLNEQVTWHEEPVTWDALGQEHSGLLFEVINWLNDNLRMPREQICDWLETLPDGNE